MNLVILLYLLIGLALYVYFIKKLGVSKLAKNRFVKSISPRMSVLLKILIPTLIFAFLEVIRPYSFCLEFVLQSNFYSMEERVLLS